MIAELERVGKDLIYSVSIGSETAMPSAGARGYDGFAVALVPER